MPNRVPTINEKRKSDNGTPGRDDQGVTAARRERLSLDDAQILRLESAAIKGHTGKVLVLAPDSEGRALSRRGFVTASRSGSPHFPG